MGPTICTSSGANQCRVAPPTLVFTQSGQHDLATFTDKQNKNVPAAKSGRGAEGSLNRKRSPEKESLNQARELQIGTTRLLAAVAQQTPLSGPESHDQIVAGQQMRMRVTCPTKHERAARGPTTGVPHSRGQLELHVHQQSTDLRIHHSGLWAKQPATA